MTEKETEGIFQIAEQAECIYLYFLKKGFNKNTALMFVSAIIAGMVHGVQAANNQDDAFTGFTALFYQERGDAR